MEASNDNGSTERTIEEISKRLAEMQQELAAREPLRIADDGGPAPLHGPAGTGSVG